jgi:hypothetical protein
MKKEYHQLWIYKSLDDYFRDTIWYSRLYSSEESCIHGCIDTEILDIADILLMYHVDKSMNESLKYKNYESLKKDIQSSNQVLALFIERIKTWLQGKESEYFVDPHTEEDNLVFWEIRSFSVASE